MGIQNKFENNTLASSLESFTAIEFAEFATCSLVGCFLGRLCYDNLNISHVGLTVLPIVVVFDNLFRGEKRNESNSSEYL